MRRSNPRTMTKSLISNNLAIFDTLTLKASYNDFEPRLLELATSFYDRIFQDDRRVAVILTKIDTMAGIDSFVDRFRFLMDNLYYTDRIKVEFAKLGRDNYQIFSALIPYSKTIRTSFLKTIEIYGGNNWNESYSAAWEEACDIIQDNIFWGVNEVESTNNLRDIDNNFVIPASELIRKHKQRQWFSQGRIFGIGGLVLLMLAGLVSILKPPMSNTTDSPPPQEVQR
jgi:hypothetical protein